MTRRSRRAIRTLHPESLRAAVGGSLNTYLAVQCGTGMTASRNTLEVMRLEVIVVY
jgi:hypothetical protein